MWTNIIRRIWHFSLTELICQLLFVCLTLNARFKPINRSQVWSICKTIVESDGIDYKMVFACRPTDQHRRTQTRIGTIRIVRTSNRAEMNALWATRIEHHLWMGFGNRVLKATDYARCGSACLNSSIEVVICFMYSAYYSFVNGYEFMDWGSTRGHIENKSYDVFRWELSCCFQFGINIITFDFDDVEFAFGCNCF